MSIKRIYDDIPLGVWKKVLNENMDYSFILEAMDNPCFSSVSTVLDVGCGWGANIRTLRNKYNIQTTGLTNSRQQFDLLQNEDVILSDAENYIPDKEYDLIMFVQSITHMKNSVLKNYQNSTNKIFITDFVSNEYKYQYDWDMRIRTKIEYEYMFNKIGFEIKEFRVWPYEKYYPFAQYWLDNILKHKITNGHQMIMLKRLCEDILGNMHRIRDVLMCDIYAEKIK